MKLNAEQKMMMLVLLIMLAAVYPFCAASYGKVIDVDYTEYRVLGVEVFIIPLFLWMTLVAVVLFVLRTKTVV